MTNPRFRVISSSYQAVSVGFYLCIHRSVFVFDNFFFKLLQKRAHILIIVKNVCNNGFKWYVYTHIGLHEWHDIAHLGMIHVMFQKKYVRMTTFGHYQLSWTNAMFNLGIVMKIMFVDDHGDDHGDDEDCDNHDDDHGDDHDDGDQGDRDDGHENVLKYAQNHHVHDVHVKMVMIMMFEDDYHETGDGYDHDYDDHDDYNDNDHHDHDGDYGDGDDHDDNDGGHDDDADAAADDDDDGDDDDVIKITTTKLCKPVVMNLCQTRNKKSLAVYC